LCFESNNTNLVLRLLINVLGTSVASNTKHSLPTAWRRVLGDYGYKI